MAIVWADVVSFRIMQWNVVPGLGRDEAVLGLMTLPLLLPLLREDPPGDNQRPCPANRTGPPPAAHPAAVEWQGLGADPVERGAVGVVGVQETGVAACTNSFVYVLVRSMDFPLTAGLKAERTARAVFGPSGGMMPVGLKMPFSLSRALA
jgi:hypothetical protein